MAKKKDQKANDPNQGVMFKAKDAQRMANVVHWFESTPRPRNPSKLPRAPGGGGGGVRIGQFAGAWPKEPGTSGTENVKTVMLYDKSQTNASPNAWNASGETVSVVNLFAYVPAPRGGPTSMWCAISLVSGTWVLVAAEC
jgi:hypothetical protein